MLWGRKSGYLANSVLLVLNSQVNLDIKDELFSKSLSELINFDLKISNSSLCLPTFVYYLCSSFNCRCIIDSSFGSDSNISFFI